MCILLVALQYTFLAYRWQHQDPWLFNFSASLVFLHEIRCYRVRGFLFKDFWWGDIELTDIAMPAALSSLSLFSPFIFLHFYDASLSTRIKIATCFHTFIPAIFFRCAQECFKHAISDLFIRLSNFLKKVTTANFGWQTSLLPSDVFFI